MIKMGFWEQYENLQNEASSPQERGRLFERFLLAFLRDGHYPGARFVWVKTYRDWIMDTQPERSQQDEGIDLVAEDAEHNLWAIQSKDHRDPVDWRELSTFVASATSPRFSFTKFLVVAVGGVTRTAEARCQERGIAVWTGEDFEHADVDWERFTWRASEEITRHVPVSLRPYQEEAVAAILSGWEENDRGKCIMPPGTGKTLVALRTVERFAQPGDLILFCAPSIALVNQTIRAWKRDATVPLRFVAVTSDHGVGRDEETGDISLIIPPTTNAEELVHAAQPVPDAITVVISTYQSLHVVADAQRQGLREFRVAVADEAHRTTGVAYEEEEEPSNFLMFHDSDRIHAHRRLYLTATPRLFTEAHRNRLEREGIRTYGMDNLETFGPEFYRYSFRRGVEEGYLANYCVRVMFFSEQRVQQMFVDWLQETDAPRVPDLVRVYALSRALMDEDIQPPLQRLITFVNSRARSQAIVDTWEGFKKRFGGSHPVFVAHMDGTMSMRERAKLLRCLETLTDREGNSVDHVLITNARVLTEGIDVPDLDAVVFLESRKSKVDLIQAIGRVVRKPPHRPNKVGTILVPIVLDVGNLEPNVPISEEQIEALLLPQEENFRTLVQIINALRAIDTAVDVYIRELLSPHESSNREPSDTVQIKFDLGLPQELEEQIRKTITTRLVAPANNRSYFGVFAATVEEVARRLRTQLDTVLSALPIEHYQEAQAAFENYVTALREVLHPNISEEDAKDFLVQHWIMAPVFSSLFPGDDLMETPVAKSFERVTEAFRAFLDRERHVLEEFYVSVRVRAQGIRTPDERQDFLRLLFEMLFKAVFPKAASRLGIVYTPVELVNFLLKSVDVVLQKHFGKTTTSSGVTIVDPFAGTGTFPALMLQRWDKETILRKLQAREFWANDVQLFAYYMLLTNLRWTIREMTGEDPGWNLPVLWVDSFQLQEEHGSWSTQFFADDYTELMRTQRDASITVVVGNPPWRSRQRDENDANQNLQYERLDERIRSTFAAETSSRNRNSLYDAYIRAIRWAMDRVGTQGVVAFVTNAGWIDGNAMDGMRKELTEECAAIYVVNLRGNQRTQGELSRREGGKIFGSGSRAAVCLVVLVKDDSHTGPAEIFYHDIGDYLSREEKLAKVRAFGSVESVPWTQIMPNDAGDWIHQRSEEFSSLMPLGGERTTSEHQVFSIRSLGVNTNRDVWVYNFSREKLERNMRTMISTYEAQFGKPEAEQSNDPRTIGWSSSLRRHAVNGRKSPFAPEKIRLALYRPFSKRFLYFDSLFNHRVSQQPYFFPRPDSKNRVIILQAPGDERNFTCLITDELSDLHTVGSTQCFPLYVYDIVENRQQDQTSLDLATPQEYAITDEALTVFQQHYEDTSITKEDIFYYVYGVLHAPDYRERFASDLRRELPRIPFAPDFWAFSQAGRKLAELHIGYERVEPYPLEEVVSLHAPEDPWERYHVKKMRFARERRDLVVNEWITLRGIPEEAFHYQVNGRSPIEWVVDQYQIKRDRASGIVNDPNDWARETAQDPRYIVDLAKRAVLVAVETIEIIHELPPAVE